MDLSSLVRFFCLLFFLVLAVFIQEQLSGKKIDKFPTSKAMCPLLKLENGKVKLRNNGRVARFTCNNGFTIFGRKLATCVGLSWKNSVPWCVKPGCKTVSPPRNGITHTFLGGAVTSFDCNSGYSLKGPSAIYCKGLVWNGTTPTCAVENSKPEMSCDFESESLCGWSHDPQSSFHWTRHRFATPSGHVGTGPSFDHTRGQGQDGYYMFVESSGRRASNDTAHLYSPVYPSTSSEDACFIIWYHMFGATTGILNVYQKREDVALNSLKPLFSKSGDQGNMWFRAVIPLETTDKPYQVIIGAAPGIGYLGDSAIDDLQLTNGSNCLEPVRDITQTTSKIETGGGGLVFNDAQSCRHRCSSEKEPLASPLDNTTVELPVMVTCDCHVGCLENDTCCPDYPQYCVLAKVTPQPVVPTLEYRTIASVHNFSLLPQQPNLRPQRPNLLLPPPLPPLPPKPTVMTSYATQTSINLTTQKRITFDQSTTSEVRPAGVPTTYTQTEVTMETMDETTAQSTGFSDQVEVTEPTDLASTSSPDESPPPSSPPTLETDLPSTSEPTQPRNSPTETTQQTTLLPESYQTSSSPDKVSYSTLPPTTQMPTIVMTAKVEQTISETSQRPSTTAAKQETPTFTTPYIQPKKKRTTKKPYFPRKKPFVPKKTLTTATPTTQRQALKITKDFVMLYPKKGVQKNVVLKKELLDSKRISDLPWQQPKKAARDNTSTASTTIGIVGGIALLLVAFGIVAFAVVRRRRLAVIGRDLSDDSDVRFLTADEVLDFNLARPTEEDDSC